MADPNQVVPLVARICLVAMFPFSAADKVWHWRNSIAQIETAGLPGAPVLLVAAIVVEALTPVGIVFDIYARTAAAILAGFCLVTAFLYHPFWRYRDLASARDDSVGREHFWQFLKNFGLIGGLLLVVAGGLTMPAIKPCAGDFWTCLLEP